MINGKLTFSIYQYGGLETVTMETPSVSDGNWYNATVTITGNFLLNRLHVMSSLISFFNPLPNYPMFKQSSGKW